ncbi:MAG: rRNA pseudouridine synthase [Oscillibacter sp.]|nr:rRNA pseudouridine synthase [Oscillibacter sp.]
MERLDKILASTGRWSRKEAKALIRGGRVLVDGAAVRSPEAKADPETASVTVNGETLLWRRTTWVMLNKPTGFLSATEDGRGPVVVDLLPPDLRKQGLFPVGRLDKDTEGLLLLTNDGELAHALLSPRHHVEKQYYARVSGLLTAADVSAFAAGLALPDGLACLPAALDILAASEEESEALVTVTEGKFHQVKRMLAARGTPVKYLERQRMGNLPLDPALSRGSFRFLTAEEVENLRSFL